MSQVEQTVKQIQTEFKVDENGKVTASIRGAARLADVDESSIRTALHSAGQKPSKMAVFLIEQGIDSAELISWIDTGIPDTALALILEYYAYETQSRYRSQQAKLCCRAFNSIGIREWIKDSIGWKESNGRPHWYRRLGLFRSKTKIPVGWWCIFEEIMSTVADLEELGYIPPEGIIPDVSVGKCWCNYLRDELKLNPKDIGQKYKHYYPDWAHPVSPYIYPLEYLPTFRMWFEETYKPTKMVGYFKKADPVALPSICKLLGLPEGK